MQDKGTRLYHKSARQQLIQKAPGHSRRQPVHPDPAIQMPHHSVKIQKACAYPEYQILCVPPPSGVGACISEYTQAVIRQSRTYAGAQHTKKHIQILHRLCPVHQRNILCQILFPSALAAVPLAYCMLSTVPVSVMQPVSTDS